jgi:hypothetical protein
MDPFFGFLAFLLVGACVLLWPLVNSFRQVPAEKGLKPISQERCSVGFGRFGISFGSNIPLNRVALYSDFMVIASFSTTVIPYQNIAEVSLKRSLGFLGALGVRLRLHGLKSYYVLFPRDPQALAGLIESHLTSRSRADRP